MRLDIAKYSVHFYNTDAILFYLAKFEKDDGKKITKIGCAPVNTDNWNA